MEDIFHHCHLLLLKWAESSVAFCLLDDIKICFQSASAFLFSIKLIGAVVFLLWKKRVCEKFPNAQFDWLLSSHDVMVLMSTLAVGLRLLYILPSHPIRTTWLSPNWT